MSKLNNLCQLAFTDEDLSIFIIFIIVINYYYGSSSVKEKKIKPSTLYYILYTVLL